MLATARSEVVRQIWPQITVSQAQVFPKLGKSMIAVGYERRLLENVDTQIGQEPFRTNARVDSAELRNHYAENFICTPKADFSKQQVEGMALAGNVCVLKRIATRA